MPVVADADKLSFWALVDAINAVALRAREGQAKPAELTGSTITLTSLGKLGGVVSTPIINCMFHSHSEIVIIKRCYIATHAESVVSHTVLNSGLDIGKFF